MRVHGDVRIKRRKIISPENDYKKYRVALSEDFYNLCGYCGKDRKVFRDRFEIDHFVPLNIDPNRKTDYYNLVYSCFTCNRKKLGKWPTQNKDLCHDGQHGFIDPASDEYDKHLGRDENGSIEYYTPIGKYMYDVFKFQIRATDKIWLAMELVKRKRILRQIKESITINEYIEIDEAIENILNYLLDYIEE